MYIITGASVTLTTVGTSDQLVQWWKVWLAGQAVDWYDGVQAKEEPGKLNHTWDHCTPTLEVLC